MPDHLTGEIRVANLAFYLGSDTCRLPIPVHPLISQTSVPLLFLPNLPYFQSSKRLLIDAEKISFALVIWRRASCI